MDPTRVDLYWLPLGAGEAPGCARWNGRIFELRAGEIRPHLRRPVKGGKP